jgi:hypothetical protein
MTRATVNAAMLRDRARWGECLPGCMTRRERWVQVLIWLARREM